MAVTVESLLEMKQSELDDLFKASPAGPIPVGPVDGTVILAPDTPVSEPLARLAHLLVWKGKVFDPATSTLCNVILPIGLRTVVAEVYPGQSWLDQKECTVLDYSKTSLIAHWIRDEIRLIAPGLYLGIVYWEHDRLINFTLSLPATA